jgi:hypothetical protein
VKVFGNGDGTSPAPPERGQNLVVELVREREVAKSVQSALERLYRLDRVADVADYLVGAGEGEREELLLREAGDGALEVSLRLPRLEGQPSLDTLCQIIEGVSHFVYVVERARTEREATQLELELQAEVDKWVFLAGSLHEFDAVQSAALREKLYERIAFEHDEATEQGERYRVANDAAHRFVRKLEREYVERARYDEMRGVLRRFFRMGQGEKLRSGRLSA